MKTFTDVNEINKIVRQQIIKQTNLFPEKVLNSLSLYGTELDKVLSELLTVGSTVVSTKNVVSGSSNTIYESIEHTDVVILFELTNRDSTNDMSEDDDTDTITYTKAYRMHIIAYGNDSNIVVTKLAGRLRSEQSRLELYNEGVYLETVSTPVTLNEFKNDTMWLRTDLDINIAVEYKFEKTVDSDAYDTISQINVIN